MSVGTVQVVITAPQIIEAGGPQRSSGCVEEVCSRHWMRHEGITIP